MDIKERFDKLVKEKEDLKVQIVQLETKRDAAKESIKNIEETWKKDWEINSFEEAKEKLEEMNKEIETVISECEEYLEKVEV